MTLSCIVTQAVVTLGCVMPTELWSAMVVIYIYMLSHKVIA